MHAFTILFIITCSFNAHSCEKLDKGWKVEEISPTTDFHILQMGNAFLQKGTWKLVTCINLNDLAFEVKRLSNLFNSAQDYCSHQEYPEMYEHCQRYDQLFKNTFDQIQTNFEIINHYTIIRKSRRKRGLINGIGDVSKYLFGTLDEDDKQELDKNLDSLKDGELENLRLIKQQTSIMKSLYHAMNETNSINDVRFREVQGKINKIIQQKLEIHEKLFKWTQAVDELHILLNTFSNQILMKQTKLITILESASRRHFHPYLLSLDKIKKEMESVSSIIIREGVTSITNLPNETKFWGKLIEIDAEVISNEIVFQIYIPLINSQRLFLLKLISLPMRNQENHFEMIDIHYQYVITDSTHENYYLVTDRQYEKFCQTAGKNHFCKPNFPKYTVGTCKMCECLLLSNQTKSSNCKIREFQLDDSLWLYVAEERYWICINPHEHEIKIKCSGDNMTPIKISTRSLITFNDSCQVLDHGITINTYKNNHSSKIIKSSLIALRNENLSFKIPRLTKKVTEEVRVMEYHSENFENIGKKIDELEIEEQNHSHKEKFEWSAHDIIFYGLFVAIASFSIIKLVIHKKSSIKEIKTEQKEISSNKTEKEISASVDEKSHNHKLKPAKRFWLC